MDLDESFIASQEFEETEQAQEVRESVRRGRKPGRKSAEKVDVKAKLARVSERSRQSARECRARKKLRYQYLEELVSDREKAVVALRVELEKYRQWFKDLDEGRVPEGLQTFLVEMGAVKKES